MADKLTVSKSLAMLSIVFQDKKTSPEFYAIYQAMLSDLPDEAVVDGVENCLCTCRFFPTIAEIRTNAQPYIDNMLAQKHIEENRRKQIAAAEEAMVKELTKWNYHKEVIRNLEDKKVNGKATRAEIERLDKLRETLAANEKNI